MWTYIIWVLEVPCLQIYKQKMYCFPVLQPSLVASNARVTFASWQLCSKCSTLLWRLKQLVASTIPQQLAALRWQCGWTMEVDTIELLCHTQRGGQHAQQLLWRWRDSIAREWKLGAGRLLAIATDANNQLLMLHLHRRNKLHTTCNHRWCQQSTTTWLAAESKGVGGPRNLWQILLACFCQHTTPSPKCKL